MRGVLLETIMPTLASTFARPVLSAASPVAATKATTGTHTFDDDGFLVSTHSFDFGKIGTIPVRPGPPPTDTAAPASYMLDGPLTYDDGAGSNTGRGGAGQDRMYGGDGDDKLYGNGGNDQLFGGNGDDTLTGDAGVNYLYGGSGDDILVGGNETDFLFGGTNSATYFGTYSSNNKGDLMIGGGGDDYFYLDGFNAGRNSDGSGGGSYHAIGGTGNDHFIIGDANYAKVYGNENTDTFTFTQAYHGRTQIMDFNVSEGDRLVFDKAVTAYGYVPGEGDADYAFYEFEGGGRVEVHNQTPTSLQGSIWEI